MKKVLLPVGILGGAALICTMLFLSKPTIDAKPFEQARPAIRVMTVKNETVTLNVNSRGKVQPAIVSELSAFVGGPVVWISPKLVAGGYFEIDEVALRIDASDYESALTRSDAQKIQAEAEAVHAKTELRRVSDLADRGLTSDSALADAKRLSDVSAARLIDAKAGFNQAKLNLSRTEIKVPFNSIVSSRKIELGQFVSTGQSVAEVFGADVVEVKLPLANKQIGFLDLPDKYSTESHSAPTVALKGSYAGKEHTWHGRLVRTEAGIDASNNTVQAIVQVNKNASQVSMQVAEINAETTVETVAIGASALDELNVDAEAELPEKKLQESTAGILSASEGAINKSGVDLPYGLFVQAEITGRTVDNVISLPRHVIRNNNQVLVVSFDDSMHFRDVEVLRVDNQNVLIQGGLEAGERVCISPIQAVVDGMKVKPIEESNSNLATP